MKIIQVDKKYKEDFLRVFNHLANLFFEDSKIKVEVDNPDMFVTFTEQHDGVNFATTATLQVEGKTYSHSYQKSYEEAVEERETNIRRKRALSHVLLEIGRASCRERV